MSAFKPLNSDGEPMVDFSVFDLPSAKSDSGLVQSSYSKKVPSSAYDECALPLTLSKFDFAGFASARNYQEHDIGGAVALDLHSRKFYLEEETAPFASIVEECIGQLGALTSLDRVGYIMFRSNFKLVEWNKTQLTNKWHSDGPLDQPRNGLPFDLSRSDKNEYIRIGGGYPFNTHFARSLTAYAVYKAWERSTDEVLLAHDAVFTPPESHLAAWRYHHVHRSPTMPSNREQAEQKLAEVIPDFPASMITDNGIMRFYFDFHAVSRFPVSANG